MSNDHDPFDPDPFDPQLAAALRGRARGSGPVPVDAAHDAVLRRASGVRRRRAAVAGGGLLAATVIGIVLVPRGDDGSERVAPADSSGVEIPGDGTGSSSSSTPSSTAVSPTTVNLDVPTVPAATSPGTSSPAPADSTVPAAPSTTTVPRSPGPTSSSSSTSTSIAPTPSTSSAPSTSTTVADPTPAPFTRTYQSGGGSITVSFDGTRLSLGSVAAAGGHDAEIEDDRADRVRVRFTGPNESRIEVRFENGEIRERIEG